MQLGFSINFRVCSATESASSVSGTAPGCSDLKHVPVRGMHDQLLWLSDKVETATMLIAGRLMPLLDMMSMAHSVVWIAPNKKLLTVVFSLVVRCRWRSQWLILDLPLALKETREPFTCH